jgi:hypothetical protein
MLPLLISLNGAITKTIGQFDLDNESAALSWSDTQMAAMPLANRGGDGQPEATPTPQ